MNQDDAELPEPTCRDCEGIDLESLPFDAARVGTSAGGLELRGAHVCPACGAAYLSRRSRQAENWKLAKSGRSVETGATRIRCEALPADDGAALMRRIALLPDVEQVVRTVRALLDRGGDPVALVQAIGAVVRSVEVA